MNDYIINLWPGAGYYLTPFNISGTQEEDAIDNLVCELIEKQLTAYYCTCDEMDRLRDEWGLDEEQDLEGYIYIDATMSGAPYPVYLLIENAKIERVAA